MSGKMRSSSRQVSTLQRGIQVTMLVILLAMASLAVNFVRGQHAAVSVPPPGVVSHGGVPAAAEVPSTPSTGNAFSAATVAEARLRDERAVAPPQPPPQPPAPAVEPAAAPNVREPVPQPPPEPVRPPQPVTEPVVVPEPEPELPPPVTPPVGDLAPPERPGHEGTRISQPANALEAAKRDVPGGPTEWDRKWAELRARRRFAGIKRSSEQPEPFMRTGMKDWTLFTQPKNEWVDVAQQFLDQHRSRLSEPDDPTLSGEVTMVTTLLDLKRGTNTGAMFKRSMKEYFARFNYILDRGFKMVIFMPHEFREHLHIKDDRMVVVHMTGQDIETYFPYYNRVQEVRTSPLWTQQAEHIGWLKQSPQASLPGYDPLVMSKTFMLRDAADLNPFHTKYFLFVDSGHMCAGAQDPNYMNVYTEHMDRGYLVTHWPYGTNSEVHGMCDKAMHIYTGKQDPLRIVRGGVFGARKQFIDIVTPIYDLALAETLSDGYMGTEENILAIIFARFPDLFADFDNNSGGNHGDNCWIFNLQSQIRKEKQKKLKEEQEKALRGGRR